MSHTLYRIKGMLNNVSGHLLSILKKKIKEKLILKKLISKILKYNFSVAKFITIYEGFYSFSKFRY
jgi:hypothetical protein